jgi:phosphoglycerate dehydrogenase-like enzyme
VSRYVIEQAAQLRVIGRAGVGLDNIDLAAARERGIVVVHTPAAATDAVADLTVGLMLASLRKIAAADRDVRAGRFHEVRDECIGPELGELTVGIVGMGRIGRAVAQRCHFGFGARILFNDIVPILGLDFPARSVSKHELYAASDVVTLHVPLTEATNGMIDAAALTRFKPGAVLINTARGAVVDSVALADALRSGHLGAAGLDVVDPEPLPADHPLLLAPHTLITPHIGARTPGGLARMNDVVEDVVAVLEGRPPRFAVRATL